MPIGYALYVGFWVLCYPRSSDVWKENEEQKRNLSASARIHYRIVRLTSTGDGLKRQGDNHRTASYAHPPSLAFL